MPALAGASQYVALGDSYTAGALTGSGDGGPLACVQSSLNYPHLVAAHFGLSLQDQSCIGATTSQMETDKQAGLPPQISAITPSTQVVTIGTGGNDLPALTLMTGSTPSSITTGFWSDLVGCLAQDLTQVLGTPCKNYWLHVFTEVSPELSPLVTPNSLTLAIDTIGGNVADLPSPQPDNITTLIAAVRAIAPQAKIFLIGYPDILPPTEACWPQVSLTNGDDQWLNQGEMDLNAELNAVANFTGVNFVDLYTNSEGRDMCQPEKFRYVEPPVPGGGGAPVHPNTAGEAYAATQVEQAMAGAGIQIQ
jgi:lysophospholipase L1-like esterase